MPSLKAHNEPVHCYRYRKGPAEGIHMHGDHSISWRRVFWRFYRLTATYDCHTTGGALYFVDPDEVSK